MNQVSTRSPKVSSSWRPHLLELRNIWPTLDIFCFFVKKKRKEKKKETSTLKQNKKEQPESTGLLGLFDLSISRAAVLESGSNVEDALAFNSVDQGFTFETPVPVPQVMRAAGSFRRPRPGQTNQANQVTRWWPSNQTKKNGFVTKLVALPITMSVAGSVSSSHFAISIRVTAAAFCRAPSMRNDLFWKKKKRK